MKKMGQISKKQPEFNESTNKEFTVENEHKVVLPDEGKQPELEVLAQVSLESTIVI